MSLTIDRFDEFFLELWAYEPFPWQSRLAKQVFDEGWPACIDLPTASGKTAAIDIAVFNLACQVMVPTNDRTIGRRIFFTVNRRVIVDEAIERTKNIATKLLEAKDGILTEVADALKEISGDKLAPPLDIAELRGGIYRDRAWARSITQPIVVCTTADQLGSRILFRGYGVSPSMQPVHAALTACDSLVLLDEAHVTKAFSQTLRLISHYRRQGEAVPPMRFVEMTATPSIAATRFELNEADLAHPTLKARQSATKPAELVRLDKKRSIANELASRAIAALTDARKAIGIIVNRVQTARDIERLIQEEIQKRTKQDETFRAEVHLVIGRMRPIDRDDLQEKLRTLVGPARPDALDYPVFVVATQCLEVGADYDFDALFTECASIDALRQRFGRLNRKARKNSDGTPIEVAAAIITNDASLKEDDPIYGNALKATWDWLNENDRQSVDFGIVEFKRLWDNLDGRSQREMLSPAPDAAVLLPAHLDVLCQTAPYPQPSPEVSFFVHGPQRDNAEVNVCWRADLGPDDETSETRWPDIVRLLPPTSPECMTIPLAALKRWMGERYKTYSDADVPTQSPEVEEKRGASKKSQSAQVVVWRYERGPSDESTKKSRLVGFVTKDREALKPGDTVVMPVDYRNWYELGHIPGATEFNYRKRGNESPDDRDKRGAQLDRSIDCAERATRQKKSRVVLRIHRAFVDSEPLRGLSSSELRQNLVARGTIPAEWNHAPVARVERHQYRISEDDNPGTAPDEVIVFKQLLCNPNKLVMPSDDEDDGEDMLSERDKFTSLDQHSRHVVDRIAPALSTLHLNGLEETIRESAALHDLGKADMRFNAMLAGITPYEAMMRSALLGKGDGRRLTKAEKMSIRARAMLPADFRHEMLSAQIVEHRYDRLVNGANVDRDLLLHIIAAHHGYARPFAPVVIDDVSDETRSIEVNGVSITAEERIKWIPSHRLDSGIAERFWLLIRKYGWWGLAWFESILRLADQQASASENNV